MRHIGTGIGAGRRRNRGRHVLASRLEAAAIFGGGPIRCDAKLIKRHLVISLSLRSGFRSLGLRLVAGRWQRCKSQSRQAACTNNHRDSHGVLRLGLFLAGTLAPALRASERPIAIACLTRHLLAGPLFSVPFLRSSITFLTLDCAFLPYVAMTVSFLRHARCEFEPSSCRRACTVPSLPVARVRHSLHLA